MYIYFSFLSFFIVFFTYITTFYVVLLKLSFENMMFKVVDKNSKNSIKKLLHNENMCKRKIFKMHFDFI